MIPKRSGLTNLDALRTIVLFEADCYYAFKHIGREMMHTAEATSSMAPEQYGSRKCHKSIDLAVNKSLTNDLLRQLKWPDGTIYPNDAKVCYDLIGHTQATLAMQKLAVPEPAMCCLFSTLQDMSHQVKTGYGDSEGSYGDSDWTAPMHGICQGNGAGPSI
jgi:hypothetical protein